MRIRSPELIVGGAVASLGLVAIAPTWLGVVVAGTAVIGWCLYLEREEQASNRQTLKLVHDRAGGTVYVLRKPYAGTLRAFDEANPCAGDRPLKMVVFVVHRARPGVEAIGSTEHRS
jgi:hypothetical protein